MLEELKKTFQYVYSYYYAKNKFYKSAMIFGNESYSLIKRNSSAGDMKKNAKHMAGLARLLKFFDDSNNEKPIQRREFEDKIWEKLNKKYK